MNLAALFSIQGKLRSLSRNQHSPRHLVSPFSLFKKSSPSTHAVLPPNRLEHRISCAARSHRICTMICTSMCGHVFLVFLGGWLSWVTDVFLTCALPSSNRLHSQRSSHSTHSHILILSFFAALTQLRSYGFSSLARSLLLPPKCWAVAVERDSPSWLSSICDFD